MAWPVLSLTKQEKEENDGNGRHLELYIFIWAFPQQTSKPLRRTFLVQR